MSAYLKQLLEHTLHLTAQFADEGSFIEMNSRSALRQIDVITDGEAFRTSDLKRRVLDLLHVGVILGQEWRREIGFVVDEFEAKVVEIEGAQALQDLRTKTLM